MVELRRRRFLWTAALVVLLFAGVVSLARVTSPARMAQQVDQGVLTRVSAAWQGFLAPLNSAMALTVKTAQGILANLAANEGLEKENAELHRRVEELTLRNQQLEEFIKENERLRALLAFQTWAEPGFQWLAARVVARSPRNWDRVLTVDRGSLDGIRPGMPVLSATGLVGRVTTVSSSSAQVLTLLDREGAVGAMLEDSRTPGILEGSGDGSGKLRLVRVFREAGIAVGDVVITSGLGGVFPKGLRIGRVIGVEPEADGLMVRAIVQPFVDFNRLEEVLVLLNPTVEKMWEPESG